MKKLLITLSLTSAFIFANASDLYNLEPTHSYVEFHYNHMGYSNPSGKWFTTGTINLDQKDLSKSSANILINVSSINTGVTKLDEHLSGKDFFDVAKFPIATFAGNKVSDIKGKHFDLSGILTIHGVTKPVTLHVTENMRGINPITKLPSIGFSANTVIKRSDFGISKYVPMVSDEIKLDIEVEANNNK